MGGWGGPEKDWILWHCLVHGLAIICHLVQVLLQGTFPGSGSGLIGYGTVFMVRDPIMVWGAVPGQHLMTFLLALQVCTHGTSGSSTIQRVLAWLYELWTSDFSWFCCTFFFYPLAFLGRPLLLLCCSFSLSILSATYTVLPLSRHRTLDCTK